jgi:crotonobetainyl-CoA:carnitine CoA-transferase CaiB-like acyl-CoA transferase
MPDTSPAAPRALSHLRILDLTRVLAGPWATQTLADMGADVIKIERPGVGDDTRAWGPPYLCDGQGEPTKDASYFMSANRGKRSVTLDIATAQGQQIVRKLAASSDVFIENYKVGTMVKYGLSYHDLAAINPRLVYCSLTGFGQSGPYAQLPGYDFVFQGMGGLMSITGFPETESMESGPVKVGVAIADLLAGMYTTTAILAAIEHRHISNKGQYIDLALLDCVVAATSYQSMNYFLSGKVPSAIGNQHPNMVPYQVFRCKEGKIILAVGNDSQYASFCKVAGRPDLIDDARFRNVAQRVANRAHLVPVVSEILLQRTMLEWVALLSEANVPCGPIYGLDQVFDDPQVRHRNIRTSLAHAAGGQVPNIASPIHFSDTPITYPNAAPLLGEHTADVLRQVAGLSSGEIDALRAKHIV